MIRCAQGWLTQQRVIAVRVTHSARACIHAGAVQGRGAPQFSNPARRPTGTASRPGEKALRPLESADDQRFPVEDLSVPPELRQMLSDQRVGLLCPGTQHADAVAGTMAGWLEEWRRAKQAEAGAPLGYTIVYGVADGREWMISYRTETPYIRRTLAEMLRPPSLYAPCSKKSLLCYTDFAENEEPVRRPAPAPDRSPARASRESSARRVGAGRDGKTGLHSRRKLATHLSVRDFKSP